MSSKQCMPWSDASSGVWSGSTLFVQVCLSEYLGQLRNVAYSSNIIALVSDVASCKNKTTELNIIYLQQRASS